MRIGIIGAGNVGGTLGRRWAGAGHEVVFGTRHPERVETPPGTRAAGVREAAEHGEVVVLATPWDGVRDALAAAGDLAGKVLFDCTNPLAKDLSGLAIGHTTSAGEQVAALAPGARVVKIFNSTGAGNMADPLYGEQAGRRRRRRRDGRGGRERASPPTWASSRWTPGRYGTRGCSSRWPCSGSPSPTSRASAPASPSSCSGGSTAGRRWPCPKAGPPVQRLLVRTVRHPDRVDERLPVGLPQDEADVQLPVGHRHDRTLAVRGVLADLAGDIVRRQRRCCPRW